MKIVITDKKAKMDGHPAQLAAILTLVLSQLLDKIPSLRKDVIEQLQCKNNAERISASDKKLKQIAKKLKQ